MNYIDYINKYKDYSFKELEYNEVDILIFSQLSYLPLDNIDFTKEYTLKEVVPFVNRGILKKYLIAQTDAVRLLDNLVNTKRYSDVLLVDYSYKLDKTYQFGVATLKVNNMFIVSFQGTDNNLSGWFEDARLSYEYPTESQVLAGRYINALIGKYHKKVIICGHSKGGNLALAGAMRTFPLKQIFIKDIYSFDGPGLKEKEFYSLSYKLVKKKLHNIITNQSIVGILFLQENMEAIKSDTYGIMAHATTSWQVSGNKLLRAKQSLISTNLDKSINEWLAKYNLDERKLIVEKTFKLIEDAGFKSFHDLTSNKLKSYLEVVKVSKELDKETRKILQNCLKLLTTTVTKTVVNTEVSKIKKIFTK